MGDFSLAAGISSFSSIGLDGANTRGVVVEAGSANTKGAWTELSAATDASTSAVHIFNMYETTSTNGAQILLDIGVGSPGSEVVIAADLHYQQSGQPAQQGVAWPLPICIPKGSRVAARMQSDVSTRRSTITCLLATSSFSGPVGLQCVDTYGANTAASTGIAVDAGASADVKGAWHEVTAALANSIHGFCLSLAGAGNSGSIAGHRWQLDIGVGAPGSEVVIVPDIPLTTNTIESYGHPQLFYGIAIKAGERVAIRAQSTTNDIIDRVFSAVFHGVR